MLINYPILQYSDFEKEFLITCDASGSPISEILSIIMIGRDLPITYASRTLDTHEQNYSTIERELLAIFWVQKHSNSCIFETGFKLLSDHKVLKWFFNNEDPDSKLARWRLQIEEYDYEIIYIPGKINSNADALFRIHLSHVQNILHSTHV